jgi:hypothetical protein
MERSTVRRGRITEWETPNWRPLAGLVGEPVVADFMWMFQVELSDGSSLQAYKHIDTRRYIHLDDQGSAFAYEPPDRYRAIDAGRVLAEVFATLPRLAGVRDEQIRASREALDRVRRRWW